MSAEEQQPEDLGEPGGMSERTARLILVGVLLLALWGIVAVLPETAYVVVGVLGTLGWQRVRGWLARRRGDTGEDEDEPDDEKRETVAETLHRLAAPNVFLADFAEARLMSVESARAVLEALDIRVRRAVRNGENTGVGVHRDDIPPLPRPLSEEPDTCVDLHNQQPTSEPIGLAGWVLKDGSEASRRHRLR